MIDTLLRMEEECAQKAVNVVRTSYASLYLLPNEWLVLSRIIYLSALRAIQQRKLTKYCIKYRRYFANAFGIHINTITEITTRLQKDGLITKQQLRPEAGQLQACIYKLTGVVYEKVKTVTIEFIRILNRHVFGRVIVSKNKSILQYTAKKSDFSYKLKDPPLTYTFEEVCKRHPQILEGV